MSYDFRSKPSSDEDSNRSIYSGQALTLGAGDISMLKQTFRHRNISGNWQGYSILEHCPEFIADHLELSPGSADRFRLAILFNDAFPPNIIICRNKRGGFLLVNPETMAINSYSKMDEILALLEQPARTH
jgi:hypothetical protein